MKTLTCVLALLSICSLKSFADESPLPDSFKDFQKIECQSDEWGKGLIFIPSQVKYQKTTNKPNVKYPCGIQFNIANTNFETSFGSDFGPSFSITATIAGKTHETSIGADKIYISDSGNIYAESRYGHYFNQKRKYIITKKGIVEQRQPYYLIDESCKVNETLVLTSQRCAKGETIAVIPKGSTVRILLDDNINSSKERCDEGFNFIVRTSFGLVGWACTSIGHISYGPPPQLDCLRETGP